MTKYALIVDDSKTMREMVSYTLSTNGFTVTDAEDGQLALTAMGTTKFDLIITDLNMPNMNGIEFIKSVRAAGSNMLTPILMLTTESDGFKKYEGKNAGATGWIVKPFNPERLMQIISKVCVV